jgi:hypothetical protein
MILNEARNSLPSISFNLTPLTPWFLFTLSYLNWLIHISVWFSCSAQTCKLYTLKHTKQASTIRAKANDDGLSKLIFQN